jgi:hypothetical protein
MLRAFFFDLHLGTDAYPNADFFSLFHWSKYVVVKEIG